MTSMVCFTNTISDTNIVKCQNNDSDTFTAAVAAAVDGVAFGIFC